MPEKKSAPGCDFLFVHQEIVDRVKTLVLTGDTAPAIRQAVEEDAQSLLRRAESLPSEKLL